MERVLVSGVSGAGKTTLATALSALLGLPRFELDALHHGPGWTPRPEFEAEVAAFSAGPRWVTEDQYRSRLGSLLWERADTVIWLDLPRRTVMGRVLRRSLVRAATRRELWNGNREGFRDWLDPEHPIRWAWSGHAKRRLRTGALLAAHPGVTAIHLRSAAQARRWLDGLSTGSAGP
ncbi:hypothetical protein [Rhizohabitans arisaemae]|uniref:hypothetical protein n=1 Tax=Rhizohabitans arisaemae TaxID=2720610 RepID=UPI0024B18DAC|nr:hypothetical protein [Rhizohabitans arisaemae]